MIHVLGGVEENLQGGEGNNLLIRSTDLYIVTSHSGEQSTSNKGKKEEKIHGYFVDL